MTSFQNKQSNSSMSELEREFQVKNRNGFSPFIEIAVQIDRLPYERRMIFLYSCAERIIPIYSLVNGEPGWGEISILRTVLQYLWEYVRDPQKNLALISKAKVKYKEMFFDHPEDEEDFAIKDCAIYGDYANYALDFTIWLIQLTVSYDVKVMVELYDQLIYTLYGYLADLYWDDLDDFNQKLTIYQRQKRMFDYEIVNKEIEKQHADLKFLQSMEELTDAAISRFKSEACELDMSILGYLPDVKANLDVVILGV
jgi:uncharacterized protein YjaG (DUF416 family)